MVLAVGICAVLTVETSAQKKPKPALKERVYWYVDYTVTVKGNGSTIPKDGYTTTVWSIDRTYSGVMKLNSSQAMPNMGVTYIEEMGSQEVLNLKSGRFTRYYSSPYEVTVPASVIINDTLSLISIRKTKCSVMTKKDVKQWLTEDRKYEVPHPFLHTDSKSLTYNVWIPILFKPYSNHPRMRNQTITMLDQTIIDRSYSCPVEKKEPAHEETLVAETYPDINSINLPKVKGLIGDGFVGGSVVEHIPDKPFPPNFLTAWEYDSGDMTPDEPVIAGVPDSKTNVKVRVRYRFSKTPI